MNWHTLWAYTPFGVKCHLIFTIFKKVRKYSKLMKNWGKIVMEKKNKTKNSVKKGEVWLNLYVETRFLWQCLNGIKKQLRHHNFRKGWITATEIFSVKEQILSSKVFKNPPPPTPVVKLRVKWLTAWISMDKTWPRNLETGHKIAAHIRAYLSEQMLWMKEFLFGTQILLGSGRTWRS